MVSVEAAIRVHPFFGKCLEVREFLWLNFDHIYVEIISLCSDGRGRCETHDSRQGPNGSLEHNCLLCFRDSTRGIEADATPEYRLCQACDPGLQRFRKAASAHRVRR